MKREDYADFDYVILGIVRDLCELARAKTRKSNAGICKNVDQINDKLEKLKELV